MYRYVTRALVSACIVSLTFIGIAAFHLATRASASTDPFQNIATAHTAPVGQPDLTSLAELQKFDSGENVNDARSLRPIAGHPSYILAMGGGYLCFFVESFGQECTSPLSTSHPVLSDEFDRDGPGGTTPTAIGVAEDGIQSLSITEDGVVHTVPVVGNVFYFTGTPSDESEPFSTIVANYADGHTAAVN